MSIKNKGYVAVRHARFALAVALLAGTASLPAFAEGNTATAMTPPAPNASNSAPQAENSLPENAETSTFNLAGARLGRTLPAPASVASAAHYAR
jgi:hypothetical protein